MKRILVLLMAILILTACAQRKVVTDGGAAGLQPDQATEEQATAGGETS